jgi:hypothetical protein
LHLAGCGCLLGNIVCTREARSFSGVCRMASPWLPFFKTGLASRDRTPIASCHRGNQALLFRGSPPAAWRVAASTALFT